MAGRGKRPASATDEQQATDERDRLREQWAEYQQLPQHERESLVAEPRRKK